MTEQASRKFPRTAVVGHATRDLIDGRARLGGAAAYAARALSVVGRRVELVTAGPADSLLAPLVEDDAIFMHRVDSDALTTFALDYSGPERVLRLAARAPTISARELSPASLGAPLV